MKDYELIEHTADVGIRVKGKDLKAIFKAAALAMFDIIAEKNPDKKSLTPKTISIRQSAANSEELFINWLNELLSLSATKEVIFEDFIIEKLDENNLSVLASGSDAKGYKINTEIKAATYHELKIIKNAKGCYAEVIFDV